MAVTLRNNIKEKKMDKLLELDGNILLWIQNNIRTPALDTIMKFFTHLGDGGAVWIAILVLLLAVKKTRRVGIVGTVAVILNAIVINLILKVAVARTRPYEVLEGLNLLVKRAVDYSFPSGHTGHSFAAAVAIFALMPRKYGIAALVLATIIAFSRIYIGIHYPSDVIAGMIIGTLMAVATLKIFKYFENNKTHH